ncbi:MAG TPA: PDZ domain-containing protein, partial [Sphingomicrobium sp.]
RGSEYSRAVAGVYGEPLLSRFRSTYDYSRYRVWLDPLPDAPPLPFDLSGLSLAKAEDGVLEVSAVMPGSPAEQAGIRVGDLVAAIDGKPSRSLSRADAVELLRQPPDTSIALTGTFGGTEGSRTLTLRELLPR